MDAVRCLMADGISLSTHIKSICVIISGRDIGKIFHKQK